MRLAHTLKKNWLSSRWSRASETTKSRKFWGWLRPSGKKRVAIRARAGSASKVITWTMKAYTHKLVKTSGKKSQFKLISYRLIGLLSIRSRNGLRRLQIRNLYLSPPQFTSNKKIWSSRLAKDMLLSTHISHRALKVTAQKFKSRIVQRKDLS